MVALVQRLPGGRSLTKELAQKGISPVTAGMLIVMAVVQGLIFVFVWRMVEHEPAPAAAAKVTQAAEAAEAPPLPAVKPKKAAAKKKQPKPKPAAKPAAVVAEVTTSDVPRIDGSGANAPTCSDLWAQNPPRAGSYPGAAYAQARQANKWITRGDLDKAQHSFCLAVHWDHENVGFLVGLSQVYLLRRDGEQAATLLNKALELNPQSTRAMGLLGDALARNGDYVEARHQWLAASGHEPNDEEGLRNLGARDLRRASRHLDRRELVLAERMFRRVVVMNPESFRAATGLSRVLTQLDDGKAARVWAKYAVSLDARSPAARIALGDAARLLGDTEAARVEYREAQLLDPSHPEANQRMRGFADE
jgi:tetratricopeptide (TPR) repeat protein